MITGIDHLGIAVHSLEEAIPLYEKAYGLHCEGIEEVPQQQVRTAFFNLNGVHLELLQPTSPESPIARFLERHGEGIHHLALASDDVPAQLAQAEAAGVRLINTHPVPGAGGKEIAFLHPKSTRGVLTELCGRPAAEDSSPAPRS